MEGIICSYHKVGIGILVNTTVNRNPAVHGIHHEIFTFTTGLHSLSVIVLLLSRAGARSRTSLYNVTVPGKLAGVISAPALVTPNWHLSIRKILLLFPECHISD
jgi:hypothetical protein